MKPLNIILSNALIENPNKGCVALSYSALWLIDKIMTDHHRDYRIYLPNSLHKEQSTRTWQMGGRSISYEPCGYTLGANPKFSPLYLLRTVWQQSVRNWSIYRHADFMLDLGQGDSFADIYGVGRFREIDRCHRLARLFRKPYCIMPQTIGPFSRPDVERKALRSVQACALTMARDNQSLRYVQQALPGYAAVREYIDLAFLLPFQAVKQDTEHLHVGLNVSALLWHGGYDGKNQFGLRCNYRDTVLQLIERLLAVPDVKVHLVAHVLDGKVTVENDYAVNVELQQHFNHPRLVVAPFFFSPIEAKGYIAGLDFFAGARMHATIGAFSAGVPVVPMAYSRKFNGLFTDTLSYAHVCDMKTMSDQEVVEMVVGQLGQRATLKAEVDARLHDVVEPRLQQLESDLTQFFGLQSDDQNK